MNTISRTLIVGLGGLIALAAPVAAATNAPMDLVGEYKQLACSYSKPKPGSALNLNAITLTNTTGQALKKGEKLNVSITYSAGKAKHFVVTLSKDLPQGTSLNLGPEFNVAKCTASYKSGPVGIRPPGLNLPATRLPGLF